MAMSGGTKVLVHTGYCGRSQYGTKYPIKLYVYYKILSQDPVKNQTNLSLGMYFTLASGLSVGSWADGGNSYLGTTQDKFNGEIPSTTTKSPTWLVEDIEMPIDHNEDGTVGDFSIAWRWDVNSSWGECERPRGTLGSDKIQIPAIQRVSTLSLGETGVKPGENKAIVVSKHSENFKSTITWACGGLSGEIAEASSDITFNWLIPLSLILQNPQGEQTCSIALQTIASDGETPIGEPETQSFTVENYAATPITDVSGEMIGSPITINYDANNLFTYQFAWGFESQPVEEAESATFTPDLAACANKIPSTTSGKLTCQLTTIYDEVTIGADAFTKTIYLPTSEKPSVTGLSIVPENILTSTNIFVKDYSKAKISISNATASIGSSLKNIIVKVDGRELEIPVGSKHVVTDILRNLNSNKVTVIATDMRDRKSDEIEISYVLQEYEKPKLNLQATRTANDWTKIEVSGQPSWKSFESNNKASLSLQYKKNSEANYSNEIKVFENAITTQTISKIIEGLDDKSSYNIKAILKDNFDETTAVYSVIGTRVNYDMNKDGLGIGKYREKGALDVEGEGYFSKGVHIGNAAFVYDEEKDAIKIIFM